MRGRSREPTALELALWHHAVREVVRRDELPGAAAPRPAGPPPAATTAPPPAPPGPAPTGSGPRLSSLPGPAPAGAASTGPVPPGPDRTPPAPAGAAPAGAAPTGRIATGSGPKATGPAGLGRAPAEAAAVGGAPEAAGPFAGVGRPSPGVVVPALDRRTVRRLQRGHYPISARLDLHGLDQASAHRALAAFLAQAQARGQRCVLVITGRGERSGAVLRRAVPRWLCEPALAGRVVGWAEAARAHGGAGALYLILRRPIAAPAAPPAVRARR